MKYIICFVIVGIILLSYRSDNHKHVWVESVNDTVIIPSPRFTQYYVSWPTGIHSGMEIVCVKCFAKKRQIVDYGRDRRGYFDFPGIQDTFSSNGVKVLQYTPLNIDTTLQ